VDPKIRFAVAWAFEEKCEKLCLMMAFASLLFTSRGQVDQQQRLVIRGIVAYAIEVLIVDPAKIAFLRRVHKFRPVERPPISVLEAVMYVSCLGTAIGMAYLTKHLRIFLGYSVSI